MIRVALAMVATVFLGLGLAGCGRTLPCACTVPEPPPELMRPLPPLPAIPTDLPLRVRT